MYANYRSDIEYHGLATGGSGLSQLEQRLDEVLKLKPDLVSVYIGSNDLINYATPQAFMERLRNYVTKLRSDGARVVICTLLPHQVPTQDNSRYNAMRKEVSELMRKADWIDGIADFAADPQMGPDEAPFNRILYKADGLHPTDGSKSNPPSGQMVLFDVYRPSMERLVADVR
jgi:lysophospholipase L1-like esterase